DIANAGLKVGNYTAQTAATSSTKATISSDVASIATDISVYVPQADIAAIEPATSTIAGINDTLTALNTALAAYDTAVQDANEPSVYTDGDIDGTAFSAFVADDAGYDDTAVQAELDAIAVALGFTAGDYSITTPMTGTAVTLGDSFSADDEEALATEITSLVNQMITDFNAANPGDTELTLDDTKLQAFLADVGVVNDG